MLLNLKPVDDLFLHTFKKAFPELKQTDEEIASKLEELGVSFYEEDVDNTVNFIVRLTLPFAMIVWLILFLLLPINYMITGRWGYDLKKSQKFPIYKLFNWLSKFNLV